MRRLLLLRFFLGEWSLDVGQCLSHVVVVRSINNVLGPRLTLLLGTTGYCLYIGSYLSVKLTLGVCDEWAVFLTRVRVCIALSTFTPVLVHSSLPRAPCWVSAPDCCGLPRGP